MSATPWGLPPLAEGAQPRFSLAVGADHMCAFGGDLSRDGGYVDAIVPRSRHGGAKDDGDRAAPRGKPDDRAARALDY